MSDSPTPSTNPVPPPPPLSASRPPSCKGRGRGTFLGVLGLGLAAVLAFGAFRALGYGPHRMGTHGGLRGGFHGPMDPATLEKRIDRIAGWVTDDLDGTPEQEAKLAAIAKAAAKDLAPVRAEIAAGHHELVEILTAQKVDRQALESVRARQLALWTRASERLTTAVADAADVLTPEQRARAAEELADHLGRHGH